MAIAAVGLVAVSVLARAVTQAGVDPPDVDRPTASDEPTPTPSSTPTEPSLPILDEDTGARIVISTDTLLGVVDPTTASVELDPLPELRGGDPPYRLLRRGDQLVFWGGDTYALDLARATAPRSLGEAMYFIPSAHDGRVWLVDDAVSSDRSARLREVDLDGHVIRDAEVATGFPQAAVSSGLVFAEGGRLLVLNPDTGRNVAAIYGAHPDGRVVAAEGDRLAWCAGDCDRIHVEDVAARPVQVIVAPGGTVFGEARFSPDGQHLAMLLLGRDGPSDPSDSEMLRDHVGLHVIDVGTGRGATVATGAFRDDARGFLDWAPDSSWVFFDLGRAPGGRFGAYRPGHDTAYVVPVTLEPSVDEFQGFAVMNAADAPHCRTATAPPPSDSFPPARWTQLAPPPYARAGQAAVWHAESSRLLLFGGERTTNEGQINPFVQAFDPTIGRWTCHAEIPSQARQGGVVLTGSHAYTWAGSPSGHLLSYDVGADVWDDLSRPSPDTVREHPFAVVWTGNEMIVWGGHHPSPPTPEGVAYDPDSATWREIAAAPVTLDEGEAVWTGKEMIVYGSPADSDDLASTGRAVGAAYDPATDSWRILAPFSFSPLGVNIEWDGSALLAWDYDERVGRYDPGTDTWQLMPDLPIEDECLGTGAALTDGRVLAWICGRATLFDPFTLTWSEVEVPTRYRGGRPSGGGHPVFPPGEPVVAGDSVYFVGATEYPDAELWRWAPAPRDG